jgi:hypothetical protein
MAATPQTSRQNLLLPDDRYKAVFSPERKYRYRWWYVWDKTKPRCLYLTDVEFGYEDVGVGGAPGE